MRTGWIVMSRPYPAPPEPPGCTDSIISPLITTDYVTLRVRVSGTDSRKVPSSNDSQETSRRRRAKAIIALASAAGFLMATDVALASNWAVSLNSGSSGQAKAGAAGSLTITATASPSPTNLLYPGSSGDVVISIVNGGSSPVQITALGLPSNTVAAAGYSDSTLQTADTLTCNALNSFVTWTGGGTLGASVTLSTPLVVAANNAASPLVVTLTNYASMGPLAASGCQGQYFSMPSLTGVTASVVNATPTASPAVDS
jgi:hypothetical protein